MAAVGCHQQESLVILLNPTNPTSPTSNKRDVQSSLIMYSSGHAKNTLVAYATLPIANRRQPGYPGCCRASTPQDHFSPYERLAVRQEDSLLEENVNRILFVDRGALQGPLRQASKAGRGMGPSYVELGITHCRKSPTKQSPENAT